MKRTLLFIIALTAFVLAQGDVQARFHPSSFSGSEPNRVSSIPDASQQLANPASPEVTGTILRTLTYHQLTSGDTYFNIQSTNPAVSDDGSRVMFTYYTYDPRYTHVMVANFDGTQVREVNRIEGSYYDLLMDISADGNKVVSSDTRQLWISNGDGSGTQKLIEFEYGRISGLRISGDGTKIFFRMFANGKRFISPGTLGSEMDRGIYVMDANGTNLRQIVGPAQVAPILGVPVDQVPWFDSTYPTIALDVSYDGSRIVFVMFDRPESGGVGQRGFSVSLNGSNLVTVVDRQAVMGCFISSDGKKISYLATPFSAPREVGIVNSDGTGRRQLTALTASGGSPFPQGIGFPDFAQYILLNNDGSKVLLGDTGILMDTLSGATLQVGIGCDAPNPVIGDGMYRVFMNSSATRFVYIIKDPENRFQLATAEINPLSLAEAPAVSAPKAEPGFVITDGRSSVTLSSRVNTNNSLISVGGRFLRNGLLDVFVCVSDRYAAILKDDGTQGDTTSGDKIFTNNQIRAFNEQFAIPGPRTIRVKAEANSGDGKRHASAIDFEPFVVTTQTPLIEVVPTSLEFGDVSVNQTKDLAVTIRNTGTIQLTVNSLMIDNARFTVVSPSAPFTLNAGATQTITVRFAPTATGQQRGTLTIASTDPASPTMPVTLAGNGVTTGVTVADHTMTGGPVPGACAKPPIKTSFTTTDTEAIQWTFASGLSVGDAIRWEWIQPNGTTYRTFNYTLTLVAQGQACFWDAIQIAGQQAASLPGNWQVRVYVKGAQILTETFTISSGVICPVITGFNPASGVVGATVTISGTGFTGASGVKFGGSANAQFTVVNDTTITATVPSGASSGTITVSKPNCNDATSTASFTVTPSGQCITVSIPTNLTGSANGTLTVPINVSDTTGKGVLSYDAVLTFDSTVLRLQNPPFDRTDTLSANMTVTTNNPSAGRLNISGFGSTPLSGAGVLLKLKFDVIGAISSCSNLNWTNFRFNEGTPCATATGGRACVVGGSISGLVSYCASSPTKPVPGVTIAAIGTPSTSTTTDYAGNYQLPNLGGGPYTVTPAKTGDVNGISSFDAAQIAQHVVGIITLNSCQQAAADTSNNGEVTSFDAAFIAQYVVGIANANNTTGTWKFLPPSRTYASLSGNQTAQNFDAVLVGEITGNWAPSSFAPQTSLRVASFAPQQTVQVSLPSLVAGSGSSLILPITVGDLTGRGVLAYDFDLIYDANLLQAQSQPVDPTVTLSANFTVTPNATPGRLRVSGFGAMPLTGSGILLKLRFNVIGSAGNSTTLTWQKFQFNEGNPAATAVNGGVTVVRHVACVSAASFLGQPLASEAIIAAFGTGLATRTEVAATVPLPTQLAGTTVQVRDGAGVIRPAPLFFVSDGQINYQIPVGTADGSATVTVTSGNGTVSSGVMAISSVAPGLFTANSSGQGVAAANVLRVKADGTQIYESASQWDAARQQFVTLPIDLGPESEQVYLILFGTGLRFLSSPSAASATLGGSVLPVFFIGPQGDYVGLDQVNLGPVPRSFAGRGEMDIVLVVDGKTANTVKVGIR